ncbi:PREDICTED: uncharacterized protein LOC106813153 [Priapulus caudatus]|uniref:Uncharacterized protein LOC106813153 n=1 Tax=Priapulus caudatus TaxID=37621 RepID=A0ABM1EKI3_PRICU|nr:PREDICTED: uncharacterized protein LOC106813153 [Priapulus caudatus]
MEHPIEETGAYRLLSCLYNVKTIEQYLVSIDPTLTKEYLQSEVSNHEYLEMIKHGLVGSVTNLECQVQDKSVRFTLAEVAAQVVEEYLSTNNPEKDSRPTVITGLRHCSDRESFTYEFSLQSLLPFVEYVSSMQTTFLVLITSRSMQILHEKIGDDLTMKLLKQPVLPAKVYRRAKQANCICIPENCIKLNMKMLTGTGYAIMLDT